ncbi:hypothetical protein [Streptosporangium sandarakinum]|uniref:hypothetical protein n=1 Tax=Streptosporangium sandarakinum TaxID=1260955 RepID=UPI0033A788C4
MPDHLEVVSPEAEDRDRKTKPFRYAEVGISHFWRVESEDGRPVVYAYGLTGTHHGHLTDRRPSPSTSTWTRRGSVPGPPARRGRDR